jgi:zinc protease
VSLLVQAGSELDPATQPGVAAAVARLVEEGGADGLSAQELAVARDALGADLHSSVEPTGAALFTSVASDVVEPTIRLLLRMAARPAFAPSDWAGVRERLIAQLAEERAHPKSLATQTLDTAIFGQHPHAHHPLGTPQSLRSLSLDALRTFHAARWGPKAATLILVGEVTTEALRGPLETLAPLWTNGVTPSAAPPPPARAAGGPRVLLVDRPGAPQSALAVGHLGESWASRDLPALQLIQTVLGGSFTSRLVQNLRERHAYTYGVRATWELGRTPGRFEIATSVRTDVTADALREIWQELQQIRTPIPSGELDKARALIEGELVSRWGTGTLAALWLSDLALHDQRLTLYGPLLDEVKTLSAEAVVQAAGRLLSPESLVIVVVGDRQLVEPRLRALPFVRSIERIDSDGTVAAQGR